MTETITIVRPDDWHLHLRDSEMLSRVAPHTAAVFGRAVVMPNLKPPITTGAMASAYRDRILEETAGTRFKPLMTIYLTDHTTPEIIKTAIAEGVIAAKLYPAGATTNSAAGVTDLANLRATFEAMQRVDMPLLLHGEVTGDVDIFDREARYLDEVLTPLMRDFPELRIVLEHITTAEAAQFIEQGTDKLACTITPQHLLYSRNAIFKGGVRPHYFCLPILKRERHREALLALATSDHSRVFLGTDSAPHRVGDKESSCGCAGCYSAYHALPLYAQAFEQAGALDKLEAFASLNGAVFYGLPKNIDTVTLIKQSWQIPERLFEGEHSVVPLDAGETLDWQIA